MFCSNCGNNIPDGTNKCPVCGTEFNSQAPQANPYPADQSNNTVNQNNYDPTVINTPTNTDTKNKLIGIGVIAAAAIVLILIIVSIFGGGAKGVVKDCIKGMKKGDADKIESCFYDETNGKSFAKIFKKSIDISYKIKDVENMDDEDIEDIEDYEDIEIDKAKIVTAIITDEDSDEDIKIEFHVIKYDGDWLIYTLNMD